MGCETQYGAGFPMDTIRTSHAPVLLLENLIDTDTRSALISLWQLGHRFEGPVSTGGDARAVDATAKVREDVMIGPSAELERLKRMTVERVVPAVRAAFASEITQFESFRVGCYDSARGGFFRAHRDNTSPYTRHRKFALTLNLNTGEYEGGQLRFPEYASPPFEPPPGAGVLFSCSLLHEALPVTRGCRFGVFGFFYDDAGAALVASYRDAGRVPGY
jgi:predicted 2-oxoglutarate/Fe(II)-dependent dioxygenase YbiX